MRFWRCALHTLKLSNFTNGPMNFDLLRCAVDFCKKKVGLKYANACNEVAFR
jgi:hypothetical protein